MNRANNAVEYGLMSQNELLRSYSELFGLRDHIITVNKGLIRSDLVDHGLNTIRRIDSKIQCVAIHMRKFENL